MADSYWAAHHKLRKVRGLARDHVCTSCGEQARDWALRPEFLTGVHGVDRPYSMNTDDYESLCLSCHRRQDLTVAERQEMARYAQSHARTSGWAIQAARRKEDPELDARLRDASRRAGQNSTGGEALVAKRAEDPELDAKIRATIAQNTQIWNRRCVDCKRVSTPGGMAAHLRKAGHSGYEVLPEGGE